MWLCCWHFCCIKLSLCYYMWFKKSLCPIEKMPVATKLLIGPVWDMIIISVVSSKWFSYNVKYKHASGLNCLLPYIWERAVTLFYKHCMQCAMYSWRCCHFCEACGHKIDPLAVYLQLHRLTSADQGWPMCYFQKQWCHRNTQISMHPSCWFHLQTLVDYRLC